MTQKLIQQGAEAKIILDEKDNLVVKDRIPKSYRIKELDEKIRKQRTKKEKNLLEKASKIINAPNPLPLKEWKIFLIDFGLGYISKKIEDKAVDLHLLKQALEARHFKNWEILFKEVLKGYEDYKESNKVLERLKAVEKRGRYKEH